MVSEETINRINYFDDLAKSKGYQDDAIDLALMFCHVEEMVEKYGTPENALEEVIKLCEKHNSGERFVAEVGALIGV